MNRVKSILKHYNRMQCYKIKNFLVWDMDDEYIDETIDFVRASEQDKKENFKNSLYDGDKYEGIYIEGNEYLISEKEGNVLIINWVDEEFSTDFSTTRIKFTMDDFIFLIKHKRDAINILNKWKI